MRFSPVRTINPPNWALTLIALLLALAVSGLALGWHPTPAERPLPKPGLPAGGDFSLPATHGATVSLHDLRGKAVLLHFGCTHCTGRSPAALRAMTDAIAQLEPKEKAQLAAVFISIDPARDTPERLGAYIAPFDSGLIGATGSDAQIADIARRYGVLYVKQNTGADAGDYRIDHAGDIYVVGKNGRVTDKLTPGVSPIKLALAIRQSLNIE